MLLVPAMMFFILWPNWGATLYGEIRGASDFKRVFTGMFTGLWITVLLSVAFLLLVAKTFGWAFYQNANAAGLQPCPRRRRAIWPYPVMFAGWLVHNTAFQVDPDPGHEPVVLRLGGHAVPVLDPGHLRRRLRPGAARPRRRGVGEAEGAGLLADPDAAARRSASARLRLHSTFHTYTLDATLVIAVTYLFSAIAVVILPWRKPDLWRASPASRIKLFGVQLVPVAGWVTIGLLGFNLYEWLTNDNYFVNNTDSLIYMGAMYVLAIVVFVTAWLSAAGRASTSACQQGDPGRVGGRLPD